ncbi:MAG: hypothetical protein QOE82_1817, partial [Thermoanaerobaculia bacterium]|nr:hypothetical protein [Thermoanaerobaculia bacterium]
QRSRSSPARRSAKAAPRFSPAVRVFRTSYLNVLSSGTPYDSAISGAEYSWNSGCGTMSGSKYPEFESTTTSSANVHVQYVNGSEPTPSCNNNTSYCSSLYDRGTKTITLYENYGPDPNNFSHLANQPGSQIVNLLAHELGHVLGLNDDSCGNGLMNQQIPQSPVITGEERTTADQGTHVIYEGTTREGCADMMDCHMSPIILDLDRSGFKLTSIADGVSFDLNGDGIPERTGWTRGGTSEALLWLDQNDNGVVDDGTELFGSAYGANGFDQLAAWDQSHAGDVIYGGNDNGAIDPGDSAWKRLRLWIDRNHDGVSQIFTLDQLGVTSIDLGYKTLHRKDGNGNEYRYETTAMVAGKHVKAIDVYFAVAAQN